MGLAWRGGGWTPEYLLRDDFLTDEAAPLTSPRTAEPGPGTLTIVDTAEQLSIAGGEIVPSAQTAAANDPKLTVEAGYARAAGRMLYARVKRVSAFGGSEISPYVGWFTTPNPTTSSHAGGVRPSAGVVAVNNFTSAFAVGLNWAADTYLDFFMVLRSTGTFMIVGDKLAFVGNANSTATMYPGVNSVTPAAEPPGIATMRVTDLPAPWNTDYGIATERLAGARTAGDTFVHEADCIIEWVITTLGTSGGGTNLRFRILDGSNYWWINITTTGTIQLIETVAASSTTRGSAATVVADGHRVVVIADGSTIRVYSNNVLRITYASATNFATETDGELDAINVGGAVSDIVSWPRLISGAAKNLLDTAVA